MNDQPTPISKLAVGVPLAIYLLIAWSFLTDPAMQKTSRGVFGSTMWGLPAHILALVTFTCLYVPFAYIFYLVLDMASYAGRRGVRIGGVLGILRYLLYEFDHPHASRYRRTIIGGGLFYLALTIAWIVYATSRGI